MVKWIAAVNDFLSILGDDEFCPHHWVHLFSTTGKFTFQKECITTNISILCSWKHITSTLARKYISLFKTWITAHIHLSKPGVCWYISLSLKTILESWYDERMNRRELPLASLIATANCTNRFHKDYIVVYTPFKWIHTSLVWSCV